MSVKIAILRTGEQLITDALGLFAGDTLVKYQFNKPCSIVVNGQFKIKEDDSENVNQLSVSLYPWPSLSKDEQVEVPSDWVVTFVSPTDDLEKMYSNQVLTNGTNFGTGEQNNSNDIVD